MAFEIVDGMTGTKHISSDDLSALNVATIGKADCVLKYGDDFKLTMASANSATLGTGVGMVGGKRFWNHAATSLTIQSGTQGQKRNDIIVARYAKTSAGIESITPVVIKGTPTTGTAADPEVTANDLKLWRVPLNGISVGDPVKLFDPVSSLATIGDSVSQYTTRTFTSPAKTVKFGDAIDIDVSVKIDGYTPICVTSVWSNHAASCCITQFRLFDDERVFATIKNLEIIHQGTWRDLVLSVTVLYRKSIA
jgi:hypothetical protein